MLGNRIQNYAEYRLYRLRKWVRLLWDDMRGFSFWVRMMGYVTVIIFFMYVLGKAPSWYAVLALVVYFILTIIRDYRTGLHNRYLKEKLREEKMEAEQ